MRSAFTFAAGLASLVSVSNGCGSEFIDLDSKQRLGRGLAEGAGHWDYEHPDQWKDEGFVNCGLSEQSPIDIPAAYLFTLNQKSGTTLESLSLQYASTSGNITNNGHTVQVNVNGQSLAENALSQIVGRSDKKNGYKLAQFHFHWAHKSSTGSEHVVNGEAHPLEIHFVHYNSKYPNLSAAAAEPDGLLVIGILFQLSTIPNPGFDKLSSSLVNLTYGANVPVSVNPEDFFAGIDLSKYFLYAGSLTTPGCFQSVTWVVMEQPAPITEAQLQTLREVPEIEEHNYRPIQELNSRAVFNRDRLFKEAMLEGNAPTSAPTESPSDSTLTTYKALTGVFVALTGILVILLGLSLASKKKTKAHAGEPKNEFAQSVSQV